MTQLLITFWLSIALNLVPQVETTPVLTAQEADAINEYVDYYNESIHGMLIIHRLLENNNQDINKYVDLDGYQINFYSNNDLPKNIFEDPEQWFYETSPEKLYNNLKQIEGNLPSQIKSNLIANTNEIHMICAKVNQIRFEIEDYIDGHDLTQREELYGVYELLEKAVSLYNGFYNSQIEFEKTIAPFVSNQLDLVSTNQFNEMYLAFAKLHTDTKNILKSFRTRDEESIVSLNTELKGSYQNYQNLLKSEKYASYSNSFQIKNINTKLEKIMSEVDEFSMGSIPVEYKLYGKYYFYHNSNLINKFNRYGNGFVNEMNKIIDEQAVVYPSFIEVPHFFQVIYPMKIIEQDYVVSDIETITEVPSSLDERVVKVSEQIIKSETNLVEIELYDYKLKDNDVVSINFNGKWLYKDLSLESEPKKLKLKLNETGINYLIIQAESVGIISPNTTAIKYKLGPKRDEIILESDLNSSALIKFSVDEE